MLSDLITMSGIPLNLASTSALSDTIQGFALTSQTDAQTQLKDLALCFNFDPAEVAGQLRCVPRGLPPYAAISDDLIGAYVYGSQPPDIYQWPRDPETELPRLAALTFFDPARDCNTNTQTAQRLTGTPASNINYTVQLTMYSDQARKICDRMLWEGQIGRQRFVTTVDDRLACLEPAKPFAFPSPAGFETIRITKKSRGVNGISNIEGRREYSSLYFSSAPAANADAQRNVLVIAGPVNPPLFLEPPSGFPGITSPTLLIAISGGEFGIVNDAWNGCQVFASTDEENWIYAGAQQGASVMGFLIGDLDNTSGRPDIVDILDISCEECGLEPPTISQYDAEIAQTPYWVGGEWLSAQKVQGLGGMTYRLTTLYRGLYGTSNVVHDQFQPFALVDSRVFRFPLPLGYVGVPIHFRFVSGGETLATVVDYLYTPGGGGYGPGTQGRPSAPVLTGANNAISGNIVNWVDLPPQNNVTAYQIWRAPGESEPFSGATQIASVGASTTQYNDLTAAPGQMYTYYVVAVNQAGSSLESNGSSSQTPLIPAPAVNGAGKATAGAAIGPNMLGYLYNQSGVAVVIPADCRYWPLRRANVWVTGTYAEGDTVTYAFPGPALFPLSLDPGETFWLGDDGAMVGSPPAAGMGYGSQMVGISDDAGNFFFSPGSYDGI